LMASSFRRAPLNQGPSVANPNAQATPAPGTPNGQNAPYGFNSRRFGGGMRGPMMGGRGFSRFGGWMPFGLGFMFLGGLLRLIIPLGVLALVAWLFYQLGRRSGTSNVQSSPAPGQPNDGSQGGRKVA